MTNTFTPRSDFAKRVRMLFACALVGAAVIGGIGSSFDFAHNVEYHDWGALIGFVVGLFMRPDKW